MDELLLMCHILEQNCLILGTRGGTASYRGAALGYDSGPPVLVALHEGDEHGRQRRVRSHFQRLVLEADLELAKDIAEEKLQERQAEGHRRKAVGDALSHDREDAMGSEESRAASEEDAEKLGDAESEGGTTP